MDPAPPHTNKPATGSTEPATGSTEPATGSTEPATGSTELALVDGRNFVIAAADGDLSRSAHHGLFASDTRILSVLSLHINRARPILISAERTGPQQVEYRLRNAGSSALPAGRLDVRRRRQLDGSSLTETIEISNRSKAPIVTTLHLAAAADFADIFEVRGRPALARVISTERPDPLTTRFTYCGPLFERSTELRSSLPFTSRALGSMSYRLHLSPGQSWRLQLQISPGGEPAVSTLARRTAWRAGLPTLHSADARLSIAWERALDDLASLLLVDEAGSILAAAGVPWFLTIFGRDSLLTAHQTLSLGTDLAVGTLRQLAALQGRMIDLAHEEQPGRIPHEVRRGELAQTGAVPFARYYGSLDATPLFVSLYAAAARVCGWLDGGPRPDWIDELRPAVEAALAWIERNAIGAGGFAWYVPRAESGLRHQVWKDSFDSYRGRDGRVVLPPIAPVEVQGYIIDAWRQMAVVYRHESRRARAHHLERAADRLAAGIERRFWMADQRTYAMGLDGNMAQIDAVTSNPGHLLWSGAVRADRAAAMADRLLEPDMLSGWGLRTMAGGEVGYDPLSYHRGSVWPHDVSLIAAGMARYGFAAAARVLIDDLLDAATASPLHRLPELYAGFDRASRADLVPYPSACSPQAWAAGAIVLLGELLAAMGEASIADEACAAARARGEGPIDFMDYLFDSDAKREASGS